jgi:hypothetical protein
MNNPAAIGGRVTVTPRQLGKLLAAILVEQVVDDTGQPDRSPSGVAWAAKQAQR